jgi:death on curing protein
MSIRPRFLKVSHVIRLHREGLDRWGGQDGIGSLSLLESAVAMPQQTWGGEYLHADIFEMAAAYAFHIAQNQAFIEGNKRAGAAAALTFLEINGVLCDANSDDQLYDALIGIATGQATKQTLADLLRSLARY